jgi:hypothetical protein
MTIHERMMPRSEREKDLLKYGRSQEQERIIKLLEAAECQGEDDWCGTIEQVIALIKGENK